MSHAPVGPVGGITEEHEDLAGYCFSLTHSMDMYFGTHQRSRLVRNLEGSTAEAGRQYIDNHLRLVNDYMRFGETAEAMSLLHRALDAARLYGRETASRREVMFSLAVTHLKRREQVGCLSASGSADCILHASGPSLQFGRRHATVAIEYLLRLLEVDPDDLGARWLLNVAHMVRGSYPNQVPSRYLIPPVALGSDYPIGSFKNIAPAVGLNAIEPAGGSIIEDFDNDGLLDIVTSTWDPCRPVRYYHNQGDGTFEDRSEAAGLDGQLGGLNMVQADYDNDGWMDFLVMRGAWIGEMRVSLLRNNHDDTFVDVTYDAGLAPPAYPSQTAAWADYDNDGDLDLFSCNESQAAPDEPNGYAFPSQLFRNNGDGTFTDVAAQAGVTNGGYCKGSVWGDYDNDDDPDLYVSNIRSENRLYRNNGDGSFTDVGPELGVTEPLDSFPTWFWDYNNDGWLDIFVAAHLGGIASVAADYLGLPNNGERPRLYRNDGTGGFTDVSWEAGVADVHAAMGANFGDLDNDGFPDFYLGTGNPMFQTMVPNVMYRNDGGEEFEDVTLSGGFGHLQKGHGIAFGDLDRDGDQDILAQVGGAYRGDLAANVLYENPGHGNHWIALRLVGVTTNRAAIGVRIRVEVATEEGTRRVYAHVSSGGSFGASTLEQEIGLGQAQRIDSLEVYWPTSGTLQVFRDLPMDTFMEIREDSAEPRVLEPARFSFPSAPR